MIIIVACIVALIFFIGSCSRLRAEKNRLEYNQGVLLDTITTYKVRDSLNAVSVGVLTLSLSELKQYRSEDAALIKDLNLRLSRVQSIGKTSTESNYDVSTELIPDTIVVHDTIVKVQRIDYKTPYIDISGIVTNSKLTANIAVRDTLVQVFHRVPKFKFLGIWFGTKGVRQEVVSKNPHTTITAAEFIEIKRKK